MKAFETEPNGPGKLSGYRAVNKKIRQEHGLNVTKDQVYDVMNELDPDGFKVYHTWRLSCSWQDEKQLFSEIEPFPKISWQNHAKFFWASLLLLSMETAGKHPGVTYLSPNWIGSTRL